MVRDFDSSIVREFEFSQYLSSLRVESSSLFLSRVFESCLIT